MQVVDSGGSIASWIQTGGVVAFAAAVLLQLRELKPLFEAIRATLASVLETQAALLERERARAERIAANDAAARRASVIAAGPENWDDGETNPIIITPTPKQRARTNPYGVRVGEYGPTRPKGDGG